MEHEVSYKMYRYTSKSVTSLSNSETRRAMLLFCTFKKEERN
jgi:hypothetical protein